MSLAMTLATAGRVLRQLRADHRTVGLLLVVPMILMGLLAWMYSDTPMFDRIGAPLLGVFPFVVMFLVTSVATLRERQSGTLERLMSMPVGKGDFIAGYAIAFGVAAAIQAVVASAFAIYVLDLNVAAPQWLLIVVAMSVALLGTALGLLASAFASTEFQAVQFMPAIVLPQFLLAGLLVPRTSLPGILEGVSNALPLSYAVDAMRTVTADANGTGDVLRDVGIVLLFVLGSIVLGSLTLKRRTP